MIKKLPFFFILVFCLFFFPKTVEACSWDSRFRTCIGECNPGYQCQGGISGCSCQPVSGPTTIPCSSNGSTCTNHSQCCSEYCADGICANLPPTSTPKPPTPTSPPCDVDGNNICNNPNPDCQSQCKPCDQGYTGPRKKLVTVIPLQIVEEIDKVLVIYTMISLIQFTVVIAQPPLPPPPVPLPPLFVKSTPVTT